MRTAILLTISILYAGGCAFDARNASLGTAPDAAEASDVAPAADGSVAADAPPDAPRVAQLIETTSSIVATGHAIYCSGGSQMVRDNAWYRAFRPSDFGVAGQLHLTAVHLGAEQARGATITIRALTYTGATGGTTLDLALATELARVTVQVPDADVPQAIDASIATTIPTGAVLVVAIESTDTFNSQGNRITYFHLGANTAGQTAPGYFASAACGESTPSSQSGTDLILSAEGTY